jgi:hypothetical protein
VEADYLDRRALRLSKFIDKPPSTPSPTIYNHLYSELKLNSKVVTFLGALGDEAGLDMARGEHAAGVLMFFLKAVVGMD